ncbi:MFS transporter [Parabacteroides provencensis]|uniref:MFS transporter n=1 Tax=Parabacteroides provencensis TaxID=1944636 RepID=UPI000C150908|nr:MFS transporter [Parabacteroides provencensis]
MKQTQQYLFPLIIIAFVFFIIGFGVGINGIMVPILEGTFSLSKGMSYLVLASTFSAFLVFGIPAGWVIKRIGYKKSLLVALCIMSAGMFLFILSARMSTSIAGFYMFLVASFIGGIGNTLLQTGINPYVTICGPLEKAAQRMCMMGIMNQSAWFLGPIFLSLFIDIKNPVIANANIPFGIAGGVITLLAVCIYFLPLPEVKAEGETDEQIEDVNNKEAIAKANAKTSIWEFPHLLLGAVALFLYVGVETLPMASVIDFANVIGVDDPARYSAIGPIGMITGYVVSIFVLQVMRQDRALALFALLALVMSLLVVFLPAARAIYCVAGLGFAHSIMWGCLWALTINNLGKFTKPASSLLVVVMVGGAVIPVLFGFILDIVKRVGQVTPCDYQEAYIIFVPCYLYILFYALSGHRIGR